MPTYNKIKAQGLKIDQKLAFETKLKSERSENPLFPHPTLISKFTWGQNECPIAQIGSTSCSFLEKVAKIKFTSRDIFNAGALT